MNSWIDLEAELDLWRDAGRIASLWWRDDDATDVTPALERLLHLASDHKVPVALAVIPATARQALAEAPAMRFSSGESPARVSVLLHGYRHVNHANQGEKKSEYAPARPIDEVEREVSTGHRRLQDFFGDRLQPVFVPPWNRISPAAVDCLPRLGMAGLSTFGPRAIQHPAAGLVQVNTHVDPVAWHGSRSYAGDDIALGATLAHLRARRTAQCDTEEPTGLLTHHLMHDEALWSFTARFLATTCRHPAAQWLPASEVFRSGANA